MAPSPGEPSPGGWFSGVFHREGVERKFSPSPLFRAVENRPAGWRGFPPGFPETGMQSSTALPRSQQPAAEDGAVPQIFHRGVHSGEGRKNGLPAQENRVFHILRPPTPTTNFIFIQRYLLFCFSKTNEDSRQALPGKTSRYGKKGPEGEEKAAAHGGQSCALWTDSVCGKDEDRQ